MDDRSPDLPVVVPRCSLVVPASDARKLAKALASDADEVVLDLEDAVAPSAKDDARAAAAQALAGSAGRAVAVRVNQIGGPWCHRDVLALVDAATGPLTLVVPKVESASDVGFVDRLVRGALAAREDSGAVPPVRIDVLVESAAALRALDEILTASELVRVAIIGYADLGADLGRDAGTDPTLWDGVRNQVVNAARAAGRGLLDGPWLSTRADEAFTRDRERARALGFEGSWVIHPAQVTEATRIFTPSDDEVAWARRVVDTLTESVAAGAGAVALDGQMLDEALAVRARSVLARSRQTSEPAR